MGLFFLFFILLCQLRPRAAIVDIRKSLTSLALRFHGSQQGHVRLNKFRQATANLVYRLSTSCRELWVFLFDPQTPLRRVHCALSHQSVWKYKHGFRPVQGCLSPLGGNNPHHVFQLVSTLQGWLVTPEDKSPEPTPLEHPWFTVPRLIQMIVEPRGK